MPRRYLFRLAALLCLALPAATAWANVMDVYGHGSRASAMGLAFTGLSDDYGAIFYNPAGLTQMRTSSIAGGYLRAEPRLSLRLTPAPGATEEERAAIRRLAREQEDVEHAGGVFVAGTFRVRPWIALGAAVYVPEQWAVRLKPLSSRLPTFAMFSDDAQRLVAQMAVAVRPIETLSFGAGVGLFADVDGRMRIPLVLNNENTSLNPDEPAPQAADPLSDLVIEFPLTLWPFAGVHWRATEWLSVGAAYRSPFQWDIRIAADVSLTLDRFTLDLADLSRIAPDLFPLQAVLTIDIPNLGGPLQVPITISGLEGEVVVTANLPVAASLAVMHFWRPQQVALGAAARPWDRLTITLDGVWSDWSAMPKPDLKLHIEDLRVNLTTLPATVRARIEAVTLPLLGTIGPLPPLDVDLPGVDLSLTVPIRIADSFSPRTRDTITPRIGVEYRLGPFPPVRFFDRIRAAVRAGYSYEPSPFSKPNGFSNLIGNDRHLATAGAGVTLQDWITLDVYGQYHYLVPIEAGRTTPDPAFPYTKLRASGYVLAGGGSIKLTW